MKFRGVFFMGFGFWRLGFGALGLLGFWAFGLCGFVALSLGFWSFGVSEFPTVHSGALIFFSFSVNNVCRFFATVWGLVCSFWGPTF